MKFSYSKTAFLVSLLPFVVAAPANELEARQSLDTTVYCGQWDSTTAGQYIMYLDQWGSSSATSGSDCSQLTSLSGTTIAWTNNWTWTGGTGVKSFTNIALNTGLNVQLSQVTSLEASWKWSQSSTGTVVADVAFDMFTSDSSGGSNAYEIMVWMANYNAGPISATYNSSGDPVPVASSVSIGGYTWDLYSGSNGSNQVFSFLPVSGTVPSFSADLNLFFKYLTTNQGLSSTQYLTTVEAGTEATSGTATLTTSEYSVVIVSTGGSTTTATTSSHSTTTGTSTSTAATGTQSAYGQCGGTGWTGPTICISGDTCTYSNAYYSQCIPS